MTHFTDQHDGFSRVALPNTNIEGRAFFEHLHYGCDLKPYGAKLLGIVWDDLDGDNVSERDDLIASEGADWVNQQEREYFARVTANWQPWRGREAAE